MLPDGHLLNQFCRDKTLPLIMGILNVTPDSFSDGNIYFDLGQAVTYAKYLISEGADIIDIGGESTRPGADLVNTDEEIARTIPVIQEIREYSDIPISIDTRKAEVAKLAIEAGANFVNDISALRYDSNMSSLLSKNPDIGLFIMHMQGEPTTMQLNPYYQDIIEEIMNFFKERASYCEQQGISSHRIILDPGIGFGKTLKHNLEVLAHLREFHSLGLPLLIGASRKRFINDIIASEPNQRLAGSLAAAQACLQANVEIIRVHDVKEHRQFIKVIKAIRAVIKI